MKKLKKGFTLIELLIVIALLGALAIGLLAALDPFEQLKKGTDTSIRNTVSEVQGAVIRYYAITGHMPWATGEEDDPPELATTSLGGTVANPDPVGLDEIIRAGELKQDFEDLAGTSAMTRIQVTSSTGEDISVCYEPQSRAFRNDPNTQYSSAGVPNVNGNQDCWDDDETWNGTCYWCVQ